MTFRWGILGAARIAQAVLPAIREAGGEVMMVGARDPQSARAQAFAAEWQIGQVATYEDVLAADLDAVYVPLPNHLHRPWSEAAMRAGKHVLTEKPLSLNAQEAGRLAGVAAETGKVLLEAFAYRFAPQHRAVLEVVRRGELGEVQLYRGVFGFKMTNPDDFRWNPAMGGGALYDVGCYPVNLARLLLGEPTSVTAQARWTPEGTDVALSGLFDYSQPDAARTDGIRSGGPLVGIDCGFDWMPEGMLGHCLVVGSEGRLELTEAYFSNTEDFRLTVNGEVRTLAPGNGYAEMVRHFQRAARGEEALLYSPQDAVNQARVLDALLLSAREGNRVWL
ncbi:Gfo/Idh/MocA family protein [Deinococcus altitudinis]|uniref:Gfo/Idh/MocA family protein n=1 Tax=Deinococcus altitudinis TaxID=468914 RepID=UPI003892A0C0